MSHAHRLGLSHQRISLLLHPHVKFVFAKMALEASRTAFVRVHKKWAIERMSITHVL